MVGGRGAPRPFGRPAGGPWRSPPASRTRRCTIYAVDAEGIAPVAFEDTEHFRLTRAFLEAPERFLRALLADDGR
jgi:hypothetical protein